MTYKANYSTLNTLSPRETEVLKLVSQGWNNYQIADHLSITVRTVESHRANGISKIGAKSRRDIYQYFRIELAKELQAEFDDTAVVINIKYPVDLSRTNIAVCT